MEPSLMRRFALMTLLSAVPLLGQTQERLLVPVALRAAVPGAYGSQWETRLVVLNRTERPVLIEGLESSCQVPLCPPLVVQPHATATAFPVVEGRPGIFLRASDTTLSHAVTAHLRVQDVSRQSETWGTEIPVVRESEALTGPTDLLDIPLGPEFRSLLRLYDFAPGANAVRVRIFRLSGKMEPPDADPLVGEWILSLTHGGDVRFPGYAQLILPPAAAGESVRVEIAPLDEGMKFWAFVSVTNNATQHITVITPQR
jgi:hypothetical protein